MDKKLEFTGERYVPEIEEATISYEHWHRYLFASKLVQGKKILDIACGEGYGSFFLAQFAQSVVGVDYDEKSVLHAADKYRQKENLTFRVGSMTDIPIVGEGMFDAIVSFESIEHIVEQDEFLKEVKRLLSRDGIFIASTPNRAVYSDKNKHRNPFHLKELYFDDFKKLLETHFLSVKIMGQKIFCGSVIWSLDDVDNQKLSIENVCFSEKGISTTEKVKPSISPYFIAVASQKKQFECSLESIMLDSEDKLIKQFSFIRKDLEDQRGFLEKLYRSRGWRFISFIHKVRLKIPIINKW
ncbi:MAG: class I SAM-dependent methyltransferase [Anaplasmataceae bacterium]|nr:class I SAM-dependent methyltransferase [Anaplasmataceae bacterium]